MITQELVAYIKQQLALNHTREEIKSTLISSGTWTISDIDEAFTSIDHVKGKIHSRRNKTIKFILVSLGILLILGI